MAETLSVRAVGAVLVCNYEALEAGARRFIGRDFLPGVGAQGGWPASKEITTVPVREEYLKSLRDGSLLAADADTAKRAGLSKDATEEHAKKVADEANAAKEFWAKLEAPPPAPEKDGDRAETITEEG